MIVRSVEAPGKASRGEEDTPPCLSEVRGSSLTERQDGAVSTSSLYLDAVSARLAPSEQIESARESLINLMSSQEVITSIAHISTSKSLLDFLQQHAQPLLLWSRLCRPPAHLIFLLSPQELLVDQSPILRNRCHLISTHYLQHQTPP